METAAKTTKEDDNNATPAYSFVAETLNENEKSNLLFELENFVVKHAMHNRPIALVTSGGTAALIEESGVRSIENFSTGLRGAISVEEFLTRGYAVIHLWRTGSASPYARVLSNRIGLKQANYGLTVDSLGKLFACGYIDDEDDWLVQQVLKEEQREAQKDMDPWLTTETSLSGTKGNATTTSKTKTSGYGTNGSSKSSGSSKKKSGRGTGNGMDNEEDDDMIDDKSLLKLHRHLHYSSKLHNSLRERTSVLKCNQLLTVPFKTVEEYLAKLELCSKAINDCHSLAIIYLAAAVSDFYIPKKHRVQHKIQSSSTSDSTNSDGKLILELSPVPKTLGLLRKVWAPNAFIVSFKLETDIDILRQKAEKAVLNYNVHMVVGNILQTRYDKVWILRPEQLRYDDTNTNIYDNVKHWHFHELFRPSSSLSSRAAAAVSSGGGDADVSSDDLEQILMDHVVQCHFEFISWRTTTGYSSSPVSTTSPHPALSQSVTKAHEAIQERKKRLENEIFWKQIKNYSITVGGSVLAILISTAINSMIQKRAHAALGGSSRRSGY